MGRKFISQKKLTKEEMFDTLVKNAIDFLDSSLDDLDKRPKNSLVDFYTSIELFLKARLMSEHWTLIISKPEIAKIDTFQIGDFHSIFLDDAIKRLENILSEPLSQRVVNNFKALGEHRNQIIHFAHTDYVDFNATKTSIVVEQWASWHYLHDLLTNKWKKIFKKYLPEIRRIHKRMMKQVEFIKARYKELEPEILKRKESGDEIIVCSHCNMESAVVSDIMDWGINYTCIVCSVSDTIVKTTDDTIPCVSCGQEYPFFDKSLNKCPHCDDKIDTNTLIEQCEKKYPEGDSWCEEEGKPHIASCHECQYERPSTFYIDGLWSCVSCFDRGWRAVVCPHCNEFVTDDMEMLKHLGCFKCREQYL